MANFLKYSDIPIYANFVSENTDPITTNSSGVFAATEASLSLDSNLSPNRFLGKTQIRNDFSVTGPLEGKFSMTFYPLIETVSDLSNLKELNIQKANQLAFFNLTGNFVSGHNIRISNFLLKKCYLQNYSVKINAYQPVSVTANFISYDVTNIVGNTLSGYAQSYGSNPTPIAKNTAQPYYHSLHALTTKMDGSTLNIPSTKTAIDINVDCQRTPIYTLGQRTPDSVVLTAVERSTNVQGENIGAVVDISGANAGATNIYFLPLSSISSSQSTTASLSSNVLYFDINGRITSQQLSVSQNSILNGKIVIKEIIL